MKSNLLKKAKWYIIGVILLAILLSVSLSFCSWDTLSINAALNNNAIGQYKEHVKLAEDNYLAEGAPGSNGQVDVGDIVTFGRYYQDKNQDNKTDIRWIVVDKDAEVYTLLSEKIMAFGSFWGAWYYDSNNVGKWGSDAEYQTFYQNYEQSTMRAWLNSYYNLRNDGGSAFGSNENKKVFRGFLQEAFNSQEQELICAKTMSGMSGYNKRGLASNENYNSMTDKVWVPSWSEIYGSNVTSGGIIGDGAPNKRLSYFNDISLTNNTKLHARTTAFASSTLSNYTLYSTEGTQNYQNSSAGDIVWWWLRSPEPANGSYAKFILTSGNPPDAYTSIPDGGIRPAVNIKL